MHDVELAAVVAILTLRIESLKIQLNNSSLPPQKSHRNGMWNVTSPQQLAVKKAVTPAVKRLRCHGPLSERSPSQSPARFCSYRRATAPPQCLDKPATTRRNLYCHYTTLASLSTRALTSSRNRPSLRLVSLHPGRCALHDLVCWREYYWDLIARLVVTRG